AREVSNETTNLRHNANSTISKISLSSPRINTRSPPILTAFAHGNQSTGRRLLLYELFTRLTLERDTKRLVAARQFITVDRAQLVLQSVGRRKPIRYRVGIRKAVDVNGLNQRDSNVPNARNITPLAGPHVAEFPKPDRLRFFPCADRRQKLFLEQEHRPRSDS